MRTIEIDKELLLVEVPKDASDFKDTGACGIYFKSKNGYYDSIYFDDIFYPSDNYEIIGLIETPNLDFDFEVDESWVERFVIKNLGEFGYINYIERKVIENRIYETECQTKEQSFRTRIQKTIQDNGLYLVNPIGTPKLPTKNDLDNRNSLWWLIHNDWQQAEEKTIKGNLLLIKKV